MHGTAVEKNVAAHCVYKINFSKIMCICWHHCFAYSVLIIWTLLRAAICNLFIVCCVSLCVATFHSTCFVWHKMIHSGLKIISVFRRDKTTPEIWIFLFFYVLPLQMRTLPCPAPEERILKIKIYEDPSCFVFITKFSVLSNQWERETGRASAEQKWYRKSLQGFSCKTWTEQTTWETQAEFNTFAPEFSFKF